MNKNLVEIYKTCKTDPKASDHFSLIFLGLAIFYSMQVGNLPILLAFGVVFVFKMIGYITFLVLPTHKRDIIETKRAKRIYDLLENGRE